MAHADKFPQVPNTGDALLKPEKQTSSPSSKAARKKRKKKKANRNITIIFYTVYFVMVAAIVSGLFFANQALNDWLVDYEASQPTARCEEIFRENFSDPDWAALYGRAGMSDTVYEGSEAFAAFMEARVGSNALTYVETSAGLSGGHKYLLKLGEETLGYFTLVDTAPAGAGISDWQLGQVALNYVCRESVTIQKDKDLTIFVNGVALTDDHTVQITTTLAEDYLPAGIHGPRVYTQYLDGLMAEPTVTAEDPDGNPVEVVYDETRDLYIAATESAAISNEEYRLVLATAKTYALRMIEKASNQELGKYFDTDSDSYKAIVSIDPWMQEWLFSSYAWGEEQISGYYRHSDSLFSVHVALPMQVTRTNGTVKEYNVDHSFFFEKQGNTWKCITMTNVDIQQQATVVRLTFKSGDSVIFTNMFAENTATLELPTVTAPEGQVFAGWFRLDTNPDGSKEYTQVFAPAEGDVVNLPAGTKLEPLTLYALYEKAE